jgi:hypothetical protein
VLTGAKRNTIKAAAATPGSKSDITGLSDQHGAHAGREVADLRRALVDVCELGREIREGGDFDADFQKIHVRQPGAYGFAKLNETRWFFQLFLRPVKTSSSCLPTVSMRAAGLLGKLAAAL